MWISSASDRQENPAKRSNNHIKNVRKYKCYGAPKQTYDGMCVIFVTMINSQCSEHWAAHYSGCDEAWSACFTGNLIRFKLLKHNTMHGDCYILIFHGVSYSIKTYKFFLILGLFLSGCSLLVISSNCHHEKTMLLNLDMNSFRTQFI